AAHAAPASIATIMARVDRYCCRVALRLPGISRARRDSSNPYRDAAQFAAHLARCITALDRRLAETIPRGRSSTEKAESVFEIYPRVVEFFQAAARDGDMVLLSSD